MASAGGGGGRKNSRVLPPRGPPDGPLRPRASRVVIAPARQPPGAFPHLAPRPVLAHRPAERRERLLCRAGARRRTGGGWASARMGPRLTAPRAASHPVDLRGERGPSSPRPSARSRGSKTRSPMRRQRQAAPCHEERYCASFTAPCCSARRGRGRGRIEGHTCASAPAAEQYGVASHRTRIGTSAAPRPASVRMVEPGADVSMGAVPTEPFVVTTPPPKRFG